MEWYFGSISEDLSVPNNEDIFDRFSSPDSWSSWDKAVGSLNETMFSSEVEQLSSASFRQGSSRHASQRQSAYPCEHSDVQLSDDISILDEADDIFFRSLFEADNISIDGAVCSPNLTQISSKVDLKSAVDFVGEKYHIQDCTNIFEDVGQFPPAKESEFQICVSEQHSNWPEDMNEVEDICMEESVLLDLQRVTFQLANKTRICFRDSLYRLAENTKDGKEDMEDCTPTTKGGTLRLRASKAKKPDTNAIDRTIATLLFNTMECSNLRTTQISDLKMPQTQYKGKSNIYEPNSYTVLGGDAEVPTFGVTNQQLMWS